MPKKYSSGLLLVLSVLTFVALFAIVNTDFQGKFLGVIFVFALYVVPAWLGEEFYDIVDKVIDARIHPGVQLRYLWHILYSILFAGIAFCVWMQLAPMLVAWEGSAFGNWLRYRQTLDETLVLSNIPAYAIGFGQHAFVTMFLFYHFEPIWMRYIWLRLIRIPSVRRFLISIEKDE